MEHDCTQEETIRHIENKLEQHVEKQKDHEATIAFQYDSLAKKIDENQIIMQRVEKTLGFIDTANVLVRSIAKFIMYLGVIIAAAVAVNEWLKK